MRTTRSLLGPAIVREVPGRVCRPLRWAAAERHLGRTARLRQAAGRVGAHGYRLTPRLGQRRARQAGRPAPLIPKLLPHAHGDKFSYLLLNAPPRHLWADRWRARRRRRRWRWRHYPTGESLRLPGLGQGGVSAACELALPAGRAFLSRCSFSLDHPVSVVGDPTDVIGLLVLVAGSRGRLISARMPRPSPCWTTLPQPAGPADERPARNQ
jgi:hypothetical protein